MRGLLATALLLALPDMGQADSDVWQLEAGDARCLFAEIDSLRRSDDDPVIIFLDACVDPAAAPTAGPFYLLNPQLREKPSGDMDKNIVYTQEELACLERPRGLFGSAPVTLPKRPQCPR